MGTGGEGRGSSPPQAFPNQTLPGTQPFRRNPEAFPWNSATGKHPSAFAKEGGSSENVNTKQIAPFGHMENALENHLLRLIQKPVRGGVQALGHHPEASCRFPHPGQPGFQILRHPGRGRRLAPPACCEHEKAEKKGPHSRSFQTALFLLFLFHHRVQSWASRKSCPVMTRKALSIGSRTVR